MKRPVVIFQSAFTRAAWRAQSRVGGPMGEIAVGRSMVRGVGTLGYRAIELQGGRLPTASLLLARLRFHWRSRGGDLSIRQGLRSTADFLVFDPWTLDHAARRGVVRENDAHRVLVLDSFGTAPESRLPYSGWVDSRRYLTPFPVRYPWGANTFLGFLIGGAVDNPLPDPEALLNRIRSSLSAKERFCVLWTKDAANVGPSERALLAALSRICPIYATISRERGYRPGILPDGVENLGYLQAEEWQALLRRASFLIGVGDPLLGIAPLDALAAGCTYINPRFTPARPINGDPALPVTSQHPFLEQIPMPFVHNVALSDTAAVEAAVESSLQTAVRREALEGEAGRALLDALGPFTEAPYLCRLREILTSLA